MTCPVPPRRSTRGSALVEFSVSAFLLVTVILATVEIDRMFLVYTSLANAARAGDRYAIVHGSSRTAATGTVNGPSSSADHTQVDAIVKNFASASLLDGSKLNITVTYSPNNDPGSTVSVKVIYPYDPFISWFPMLAVNLGSTSSGVITF